MFSVCFLTITTEAPSSLQLLRDLKALPPHQNAISSINEGNRKARQNVVTKTTSGDEGTRTPDPLRAKQVLYQLSYIPWYAFEWG